MPIRSKRKDLAVRDGTTTRERIRSAALELFSTYGFEAVTTRQIATAAGMELGHLTYYFSNKETLWRELLEEKRIGFERAVDEAFAGAAGKRTARARAAFVLPRFIGYMAHEPQLARLIQQEFSVQSPRHDWVVTTCAEPLWIRLKPLFDALGDEGVLSIDSTTAYFSLVSACVTLFASAREVMRLSGRDVTAPAHLEEVVRYLLLPLLGGTAETRKAISDGLKASAAVP